MDFKDTIINSLIVMRDNAKSEGGMFKARAYDKVIKNLNNFSGPITKYEDIENIEGAGKNIKAKFKEIFQTGSLKSAEKILNNSDNDLINKLLQVYGIGPKKAKDLIDIHKVKSIKDLRKKSEEDDKLLTSAQKIGLLCYDDLLERIPRDEMLKHQKILNLTEDDGQIVGSFRRGEESSGDIDVMLNMDERDFIIYIQDLLDIGYLKYILAKGKTKMLGICKLKNGKYRRLDLIRNSKEEYPYMLMYFTGSKEFNVAFRQHCLDIGLSLNEHGFTPEVKGLETERDIFKYVGLKYIKPENRDGNAIIKLT